MTKDEMKDKISMALKDPILQQGFEIICKNLAELEKENAELKRRLDNLFNSDCWASEKLTKAKELIEDMYDKIPASHSDYYKDVMERARQFLKEIEK